MGWSFNGTSNIQGYFGYQLSTFDGQRAKYNNDTELTQRITSVSIQMEAGHNRFHWYGADVKGSGDIENFYITITDSNGSKKTSNKVTISDTIESSYNSTTGEYYFDYSDVNTTYTFEFSDYPVVYAGATVYVDFAALRDSAVMPGHVLCFNKNNGTISGTTLPNTYTITFDPNGGTGGPGSLIKTYDVDLVVPADIPTRSGFQFKEWSTEPNSSKWAVKPGETIKANESKKMYALWTANLTVKYYSNFATSAFSGAPESVSSTTNALVRVYDFVSDTAYPYGLHDYKNLGDGTYLAKVGYIATGNWGTSTSGGTLISQSTGYTSGQKLAEALDTTLVNGNTTKKVYAQWSPISYTIKYYSNGGSGSMNDSIHNYDSDKKLSANSYTKTGYTFKNWTTKANGTGNTYTDQQLVRNLTTLNNGTISLYAQWDAKTVKVTFYKNDDSGSTAEQSFTYGKSGNRFGYNTNGKPVWSDNSGQFGGWDRIGYTLLGWSESPSATTATYSIYSSVADWWIDKNSPEIDLYAVWQKNYYAGVSPDVTESSDWKDSHLYVKVGSEWEAVDDIWVKPYSSWKEGTL